MKDYDKKVGFLAEDDSHLPKPKRKDWKQLEPAPQAGQLPYELFHNTVTDYYMCVHNDGNKILGRNMEQLHQRISKKYGS